MFATGLLDPNHVATLILFHALQMSLVIHCPRTAALPLSSLSRTKTSSQEEKGKQMSMWLLYFLNQSRTAMHVTVTDLSQGFWASALAPDICLSFSSRELESVREIDDSSSAPVGWHCMMSDICNEWKRMRFETWFDLTDLWKTLRISISTTFSIGNQGLCPGLQLQVMKYDAARRRNMSR